MAKKKVTVSEGVDVLSHRLVPKVKVLSETEVKHVLSTYSISREQLARIKASDAMVVALKATVGDVLAIERKDETGAYAAYKIVING